MLLIRSLRLGLGWVVGGIGNCWCGVASCSFVAVGVDSL
jgi:hypothetical protein